MDGDVGGIQGGNRIQRPAEAIKRILWQTGNQVHIDGGKACIHRLLIAIEDIFCGVGSSTGFQNGIFHSLGIDAHPVSAMASDGTKLFRGQGIRSAALHGELKTPAQVKGLGNSVQQAGHLVAGEGGGRTTAYINSTNGFL